MKDFIFIMPRIIDAEDICTMLQTLALIIIALRRRTYKCKKTEEY